MLSRTLEQLMNRIFPSGSRDSYCEIAWWTGRLKERRQAKENLMKEVALLSISLSFPIHLSDVGRWGWHATPMKKKKKKKKDHFGAQSGFSCSNNC